MKMSTATHRSRILVSLSALVLAAAGAAWWMPSGPPTADEPAVEPAAAVQEPAEAPVVSPSGLPVQAPPALAATGAAVAEDVRWQSADLGEASGPGRTRRLSEVLGRLDTARAFLENEGDPVVPEDCARCEILFSTAERKLIAWQLGNHMQGLDELHVRMRASLRDGTPEQALSLHDGEYPQLVRELGDSLGPDVISWLALVGVLSPERPAVALDGRALVARRRGEYIASKETGDPAEGEGG